MPAFGGAAHPPPPHHAEPTPKRASQAKPTMLGSPPGAGESVNSAMDSAMDSAMPGKPIAWPASEPAHALKATEHETGPADASLDAPARAAGESPEPSSFEVRVHRADGVPQPIDRLSRRFIELWTLNTVYVLDPNLTCIRVYDPRTEENENDHPFIGSRLVGGQRNEGGNVEMSYPIPEQGSSAVFESERAHKRRFTRTSVVERVVLHTSVITITDDHRAPSWEVITGSSE